MPGYTGYHTSQKRSWSATTTAIVVTAHLLVGTAIYRIAQTDYVQNLIKVSKLTTVQEPVKPPDPPLPPERMPEPDVLPELPPDPPPVVKPAQTDPPAEAPPAEAEPPGPPSADAGGTDSRPVDATPFAIGKGRGRFAGYEDLLTAAIQAVYQPPSDLPDVEYAVLCQLILDEEGYVLSYKLVNSSGSSAFDRSTQQALSRLRQVRPPPSGMSRTIVVKFFPP